MWGGGGATTQTTQQTCPKLGFPKHGIFVHGVPRSIGFHTPVGPTAAGLPSGPPGRIPVTEPRPANGSPSHRIFDVVHNIFIRS